MDEQTIQMQLGDDGIVCFSERTESLLNEVAKRLSQSLNRSVNAYTVAVGLMLVPKRRWNLNSDELSGYVEWVLDRLERTPDQPIPADEIRSIAQLGRLPLRTNPRIRVLHDGLEAPVDVLPIFQRLIERLQPTLDLPIELHHVTYALTCMLPVGTYVLGSDLDLESAENTERIAHFLQTVYDDQGQLPQIKDEDEPGSDS